MAATKLEPDATTWVMQTNEGTMRRICVADMTSQHLHRWIQYFRRKWRANGLTGTDTEIDAAIRKVIVTAPAIYAEAAKRGIYNMVTADAPRTEPAPAPESPGTRLITLDEE